MNHKIGTALTLTLTLSASVAVGQPHASADDPWTTVAEDGWWTLEDGRRFDLSRGLKVLRHAETGHERIVPQAYGTASQTFETIPFSAFLPSSSSVLWTQDLSSGYGERVGSGPVFFAYAPLQVQSGLRIVGIELEACDETSNGSLTVALQRCPVFVEDSCTVTGGASVSTGFEAASGCSLYFNPTDGSHTIDNRNNVYILNVADVSSGGGDLRLRSVRLFLQRQVSPPPATATFDDVPTGHLFFQHIEALAASAITAGCDPGNFCPDAPLTRGQMAVFLAKALGLHWPDL